MHDYSFAPTVTFGPLLSAVQPTDASRNFIEGFFFSFPLGSKQLGWPGGCCFFNLDYPLYLILFQILYIYKKND